MGEESKRKDQNLSPITVLIWLPGSYHLFKFNSALQFWLSQRSSCDPRPFLSIFPTFFFFLMQPISSSSIYLLTQNFPKALCLIYSFHQFPKTSRLPGDWVISVPPTLWCWSPLGTRVGGQLEGPAAWASVFDAPTHGATCCSHPQWDHVCFAERALGTSL